MTLTPEEFKRLSIIRAKYQSEIVKDGFASFGLGQKKTTKVNEDPLSHKDRNRINEIKDKQLGYDDEYNDPFF